MIEVRAALRQKRGRGDLSANALQQILASFTQDLTLGFYDVVSPSWDEVFTQVETISASHTATTLCRTLDALHVALAIELGASEFCTFDKRQALLAEAMGLVVVM